MRKKKSIAILILVAVTTVLLLFTAIVGWGNNHTGSARNIGLGLDLEGGVSITYQVVGGAPSAEDMSDTIYKLQRRVEEFSPESAVFQEGYDRINIEIPGVTDANYILQQLGSPGSLLFIRQRDDHGFENYEFFGEDGIFLTRPIEELMETGDVILTGTDVSSATAGVGEDQWGNTEFVVNLTFTSEGSALFAAATTHAFNNAESIAIYFDGEIISAPIVQSAITTGEAQITGNFTFPEAENLASTIRIGGLTLELEELRSNVLGAQLGQDAIETSVLAGIIGLVIVIVFMCAVFLLPGVAASIALIIYSALTLILVNAFEITITLPGIAGIILGIGMALDANIIIFARVKEELALGISLRQSIKNGFQKALTAILDGEFTTLIAAAILWFRGSGTVRSFAQTLSLSIVLSLFTAIVVTRVIIFAMHDAGLKKEKFYARIKEKREPYDFLAKRKWYAYISIGIILAGFAVMGVNNARGEGILNFSLEFLGGSSVQVAFDKDFTLEEIDEMIAPEFARFVGDGHVQFQKVAGSYDVIFRTSTLELDEREAITNFLYQEFGVREEGIATENISATISAEMRTAAFWALGIAVILMILYIWIRFKNIRFSLSMVISILNDVLFVLAFYAFTRILVGNTFIAVMLTVFGYSSNSTIVTFDRIRSELRLKAARGEGLKEVINRSVTATLTRTIYTTASTVIVLLVLYLLGVHAIRIFALPLMVGIGVGVYTSVCVAPSILYVMKTKWPQDDD